MKKPLTLTFYEVGDVYSVDGYGTFECIARFSNQVVANLYAKGRGNYGNDARVVEKTYTICDSIAEVEIANKQAAKAAALRKLTPEERELLGV